MEYKINQLGKIAGITTRTLRYYDEIGLLSPKYTTDAGYRMYGTEEVDKLQLILFYRELDLPLEIISTLLKKPENETISLLEEHKIALLNKRNRLNDMLVSINQTIAYRKGDLTMTDTQKFEAFKQSKIVENEKKYGKELREKYGDETIEKTNKHLLKMKEKEYLQQQTTEEQLLALLKENIHQLEIPSEIANHIFALHKKWITAAWGWYDLASHRGVGMSYPLSDDFINYYDSRCGEGATIKLSAIIEHYTH